MISETPLTRIRKIISRQAASSAIEFLASEESSIQNLRWTDGKDNYHIYESDTAVKDNGIAWYQWSDRDQFLLVVCEENQYFEWEPITYNPIFGCICILLEWYKDHLLFAYQEKHSIYVCSYQNGVVKTFEIQGAEVARKDELLSYFKFQNRSSEEVHILQLPNLQALDSISKEEAVAKNILPKGINQPEGFLDHTPS